MQQDWTVNEETRRANSSELFSQISERIAEIIRESAHDLIAGRTDSVARLITAQLAHVHGFGPGYAKQVEYHKFLSENPIGRMLVSACADAHNNDIDPYEATLRQFQLLEKDL